MLVRRTNDLATKRRRAGFSLLELSIVLVIAGLMTLVYLQFNESAESGDSSGATKAQLALIDRAVLAYVAKNDRFPRPAARTAGVEDPLYGREVPLALVTTILDTDASGKVLFGALPFQELGLATSFAGDAWGNKFTYVVTNELTDATLFNRAPPNDIKEEITVDTGSVVNPEKVAYAVISHGLNALGAVKTNYRDPSVTPNRQWCSAGTGIERKNCTVSNTIAAASFNDGKDAGNATFDDLIVFNGKPKRVFNGLCNNAVANGCMVGITSNSTGNATCGTVRTWTCLGTNGGTDDMTCNFTNPICLSCTQTTLNWGAGCAGPIVPNPTAHGATTSTVTNTNASYAGTAAAICDNGVLTTTSSTCTPLPTNGACNNAVAGACAAGVPSNDNGQNACGTTRTWHCNSTDGGTNDTGCSFTNAACNNCTSASLTWGSGCIGVFPNTNHANTSTSVTNTNASYTGNATALCTNGAFATPVGPCDPVVPEPGACDTANAGACVAGDVANDDGLTACGTTRTWDCNGRNGGSNATGCTKVNPACGCVAGWGVEYLFSQEGVDADCIAYQSTVGDCTSGLGGNSPSTTGRINRCITQITDLGTGMCSVYARSCGGAPTNCAARPEAWSVGADNCSGSTPFILDGASAPVPNTASGLVGSVTMSCNAGVLTQSGGTCAPSGGGCVWGPIVDLDNDSVFVDCSSMTAGQCNVASQAACTVLFQPQIDSYGGCTSGQGGSTPSTTGNTFECVTSVAGQNANACRLLGRRCL